MYNRRRRWSPEGRRTCKTRKRSPSWGHDRHHRLLQYWKSPCRSRSRSPERETYRGRFHKAVSRDPITISASSKTDIYSMCSAAVEKAGTINPCHQVSLKHLHSTSSSYSSSLSIEDMVEIVGNLGEGTFGKVVECLDHDRGSILVALKIIRNERTYREAAEVEINVLKMIRERDQENKYMCVLMQDYFEHHEHVCIVFDLLGKSTYDFQKENHFLPYTLGNIRNMAFQLCHSLNFLKENNLTHTDMKPENIVFVNSDFETSYNEDKKCEEKTIKNSSIRLIDFGSATFDHQYHSTIVATRHYRPPEVILELGWSHPCDIWSLGCILFEYYTGSPLFMTHDDREHLVMMENILGPLPRCMVYKTKNTSKMGRSYGMKPHQTDAMYRRTAVLYGWADYKLRLKHKLSKARQHARATGGGPPLELGLSLLKERASVAISMPEIVGVGDIDTGSSAPQVGQLSSLVLKENNLTHTDMKPENIVFVNSDFETSYNEDKTHDDQEHLVMMEKILGPLPRCMVYKTKKQKYFQNGSIIWDETTPDGRYVSKNCRPLRSYMTEDTPEHREFFDLLEKMLQYDPTLRITPSEALEHPFFNNLSPEERNCVARHLGISEDEENNS